MPYMKLYTVERWSCGRPIDRRRFFAASREAALASAKEVWPYAATLIVTRVQTG